MMRGHCSLMPGKQRRSPHHAKIVAATGILAVIGLCVLFGTSLYSAHAVPDSAQGIWHKIRPGDTVWDIGKLYGVPHRTILNANRLRNPKRLQVGKKLFIPGVRAPRANRDLVHVVARGDTLWDLARKYHVRLSDLRKANQGLSASKLRVGKSIVIPSVPQRYRFGKPLQGTLLVTSKYGYRIHPLSKRRKFHHGIDFRAKVGTSVLAADNGEVVFVGYYGGYGKTMILKHKNGYTTLYGHLSKILMPHGSKVKRGERIARSGSTGYVTGPHLHFEVRKMEKSEDPTLYLQG